MGTDNKNKGGNAMIKMTICLRRKKGLTQEQFSDYWLNKHGPLVKKHAGVLRIARYAQCHTRAAVQELYDAARKSAGLPPAPEPYDGFVEMWWNSMEDFKAASVDPEAMKARSELFHDERQFIDHANSLANYGEEHVIVG